MQPLSTNNSQPPYHLLLGREEIAVAATALRLLVADEAHEPLIRRLARDVLAGLEGDVDDRGVLTLALAPQQMKITHTALRVLYRDLGRDEASELEILRAILNKLPDEHTMRAITIA